MKHLSGKVLTFALVLGIAGCSGFRDSRINPLNWFGRSTEGPGTVVVAEEPADPRSLVAAVTDLTVTSTPTGAIVTAVGLPPTQGWFEAELVAENFGDPVEGVMTYRFVVFPPPTATRTSTPQSREVTAGKFLSNIDLETISEIVVQGASNSRSVRR